MKYKTFNDWFSKVNFRKTAYFAKELKPLLELCWIAARPVKKPTRSKGANAYYWAVVIPCFLEAMGVEGKSKTSKNYMHYDILGQELRQIEDELRPGKTKTQATHDMDGSNFWKYIYKCTSFYAEWYSIPENPAKIPEPKYLGYDTSKK